MSTNQHALVIGAGIAGPVLAMFLKKAGFTVAVYEAYSARAEGGGSMAVAPNGMNVLDEIGLADAVIAAGTICARMAFRTQDGKALGAMPYGPPGRYGRPAVAISRATLHRILADAAVEAGVVVHYGKRLREIVNGENGVTASFADGSVATGDFLVGADGIHSRVREILLPDGPRPAFTGLVGPGGFVPRSVLPVTRRDDEETMVFYFGDGAFFGYGFGDRSSEDSGFWWTALERDRPLDDEERPAMSLETVRDALLASGGTWDPAVEKIVDATTRFIPPLNLFDVATLPQWWKNRVVLIGDAAHAMSPHSGQGASVALEDAIVLAKVLRDNRGPLAHAFADFERERRRRAERIVAYGRKSGDTKKKRGAVGAWLQRALMPLFIRMSGFGLNWVFGYRVRWDDAAEEERKAA